MINDYLCEPELNISPSVKQLLDEKKIYFTFSYFGQLRCYKHGELIWYECAPTTQNELGGLILDMDYLVKKGNECVEFFVKNGYIPNK